MAGPNLELLRTFSEDRALACEMLFPHRHTDESPAFHVELIDLWNCADEFVATEVFRDGGKTTRAEENLCLAGCFGNFTYWLVIGETFTKACDRIAGIDYECRTNKLLQAMFGGPVLARKSTEDRIWFKSGAMLQGFGWEQELQGLKKLAHRPTGAYLDDIENAERTRDKAAVDAGMHKFYFELVPALDRHNPRIRFAQVRRAEDCMMTRFALSPDWLYRAFPICDGEPNDPNATPLWPSRYPMAWIKEQHDKFQRAGMLGAFLQSYMLRATDPASKTFKADQFAEVDFSPYHWMPRYAIYDPSRTSNEKRTKTVSQSARMGKVVVSRMGSKIIVHESSGEFWTPSEFIDDLFVANEKHSPVKIAVEKNSLDDWLLQPIRMEQMRRGVALPLDALTAPQDQSKEQFILGLQPYMAAHDVVLVGGRAMHPQLVAEASNFPTGPRDTLNALAYALRVFAGIPMYEDFSGANIADAPSPKLGETVFCAFAANGSEAVAVAVVRDGMRFAVAADWTHAGATSEAVKALAFDLRTTFPKAAFQAWVPAELYDQAQRIALVSSLRAENLTPYRAEHIAVARGTLSTRIRTKWHNHTMLTVDKRARLTLNALGAGYALPVGKGGRSGHEPEPGLSRLCAEALECMVAQLDRFSDVDDDGFPRGANVAHTPAGVPYVTANPRARG